MVIQDDTGSSDTSYVDETVTAETRYANRVTASNTLGGFSQRSSYSDTTAAQ